jgi:hypothetical protein
MGIKVNFTTEEADSKVFDVPPSGEYICYIRNIELKQVKPGGENAGKPYWFVQFTVAEGPYEKSSLISNIMLFAGKPGTLSSLSQLMKAIGFDITAGEFELPDAEDIVGKKVLVRGTKKKAETKDGRDLPERFQISGYKSVSGARVASGVDSLLP